MNSLQRYVLALSRVLLAIIFLLSGLGIISQAFRGQTVGNGREARRLLPAC